MGGVSSLFVRVELGLGRDHGGEFLGCLLLGDGDAGAAQRRCGLHPGGHLSRLLVTVGWVPHGSDEGKTKKKKKKKTVCISWVVSKGLCSTRQSNYARIRSKSICFISSIESEKDNRRSDLTCINVSNLMK